MRPPNILLIMTDQQRADSLGAYGARWVPTPNLDCLAQDGTRFANCVVNNPICTPARASLMTGQELPGHGVYRLHDVLPETETLFPERLRREAGYRTGLFGKLHVSARAREEDHRHPRDGFETYEWCIESCISMDSVFNGYVRWLRERDPDFLADLAARRRGVLHHPEEVHFTRWAGERTAAFIREHAGGPAPFFAMMSVFDPHNPYEDYPETMAGRIDRGAIPAPIPRNALPAAARREREGSYLGRDITPAQIEEMRFGYAASIAFADQEIGKVLATLEECGIADDTLVIFASDHGDALGDHGLMVKGVALYDPVIRVPLILRRPGHVPAGNVVDAMVQLHDIAGTCLGAAGLAPRTDPAKHGFDEARDLAAIAAGTAPARDIAFCAYRNSGISSDHGYWDPPMSATAACTPDSKLILYEMGGTTEWEFLDRGADPDETINWAGEPSVAGRQGALTSALAGWLQREGACGGGRGGECWPVADPLLVNALTPAAG